MREKERGVGRSERAIQGTCPLSQSLQEGEAHMHSENHTHTHTDTGEAATFSQPALQTDSTKRSLGGAR